jgi:hypothetical protein
MYLTKEINIQKIFCSIGLSMSQVLIVRKLSENNIVFIR